MRSIILALFLLVPCAAMAADAPPPPPKTTPVALTEEEIQVIASALNIAAGDCAQNSVGCIVGIKKPPILAKLQDAMAAMHK